jgi:hypothetical protein
MASTLIASLVACIVGFIIIATIYGFYLGLTNKAVFYNDRADLTISSLPLVAFIVTIIAVFIVHAVWSNTAITLAAWFIGIGGTSYLYGVTAMNAYRYNRGSLKRAIPISIAKVAIAIIAFFAMGRSGDRTKQTSEQKVVDAAWTVGKLAVLGWLYRQLINGSEVYPEENAV